MKFSHWIDGYKTPSFRVFKLSDGAYTWVELTSLDEHALFLGQVFCKVVHVPVIINGRGRVERNHIYYFDQLLCSRHNTKCLERLDLGTNTLYFGKRESVDGFQRIMSSEYHYGHQDGNSDCIWVLPPVL
jgi:hypothetical protein